MYYINRPIKCTKGPIYVGPISANSKLEIEFSLNHRRFSEKMAKSMATLDSGTTCSSWNYSGHRLAAGSLDGSLSIYDSSPSTFTCTSKVRVSESSIVKIVWLPCEYGDSVACICQDGTLSIWEELSPGNISIAKCAMDSLFEKVKEFIVFVW